MMNVEKLNRYQKLNTEIELLSDEIAELTNNHEMDVVKSSYSDFPFTEHPQKIYGNSNSTLNQIIKKQREKVELEALKIEIEQFIENISDNTIRQILKYKYIRGYSWQRVAMLTKLKNESTVRMKCKRFFEKNSHKI